MRRSVFQQIKLQLDGIVPVVGLQLSLPGKRDQNRNTGSMELYYLQGSLYDAGGLGSGLP